MRQFIAVHLATGEATLVTGEVGKNYSYPYYKLARKAGYRWPADSIVRIVPKGREIALPFDEIPLIIRRAR